MNSKVNKETLILWVITSCSSFDNKPKPLDGSVKIWGPVIFVIAKKKFVFILNKIYAIS